MGELTTILDAVRRGDEAAAEQLLPLVYDELRRIAACKMAHEVPGQTLQPTALVHEAWLKLGGDQQPAWQNRAHFFSAAAEAMRRILIDRARRREVRARSGLDAPEELSESRIGQELSNPDLLAIDELLDRLNAIDPDAARLVKLRYFVGFSMSETADALELSQRQAERLWTFGKAWLRDAIQRERA